MFMDLFELLLKVESRVKAHMRSTTILLSQRNCPRDSTNVGLVRKRWLAMAEGRK